MLLLNIKYKLIITKSIRKEAAQKNSTNLFGHVRPNFVLLKQAYTLQKVSDPEGTDKLWKTLLQKQTNKQKLRIGRLK